MDAIEKLIERNTVAIDHLRAEIDALRREMVEKEKRFFSAGITVLAGIVVTLGGVIWRYRAVIFGGDG